MFTTRLTSLRKKSNQYRNLFANSTSSSLKVQLIGKVSLWPSCSSRLFRNSTMPSGLHMLRSYALISLSYRSFAFLLALSCFHYFSIINRLLIVRVLLHYSIRTARMDWHGSILAGNITSNIYTIEIRLGANERS